MREIRKSGSAGGGGASRPYPNPCRDETRGGASKLLFAPGHRKRYLGEHLVHFFFAKGKAP